MPRRGKVKDPDTPGVQNYSWWGARDFLGFEGSNLVATRKTGSSFPFLPQGLKNRVRGHTEPQSPVPRAPTLTPASRLPSPPKAGKPRRSSKSHLGWRWGRRRWTRGAGGGHGTQEASAELWARSWLGRPGSLQAGTGSLDIAPKASSWLASFSEVFQGPKTESRGG